MSVGQHPAAWNQASPRPRHVITVIAGKPVTYSERCWKMYDLLAGRKGKLDPAALKHLFLDPTLGIYNPHMTIDAFMFNITRGLGSSGGWTSFRISAKNSRSR